MPLGIIDTWRYCRDVNPNPHDSHNADYGVRFAITPVRSLPYHSVTDILLMAFF